jgi:hypothetical protein
MSEDLAEKGRDYIRLHGRGGFVDGLILQMTNRIEELERQLLAAQLATATLTAQKEEQGAA